MRRAHHPEQKETRRRAILAGASQLFTRTPYDALRMADLASHLGLGKGTLYLYFPSKEALFLAVLTEQLGAWFDGAEARLRALEVGAPPRLVARALASELLAHPDLPALQALVHGVLERNAPEAETAAFVQFLRAGASRIGAALERTLPNLPQGRGADYLVRFYGLVIGVQQMSARPPSVQAAVAAPEMGLFQFRFEDVFLGAAADLLSGMLAGELAGAS